MQFNQQFMRTYRNLPRRALAGVSVLLFMATLVMNHALVFAQTATITKGTTSRDGQTVDAIYVSGSGATATLRDIVNTPATASLVIPPIEPSGPWTLQAPIIVRDGATLVIDGGAAVASNQRVAVLRMRSENDTATPPENGPYDYSLFAWIAAQDATITIANTTITSWDAAANAPDTEYKDGRPYVVAEGNARLDLSNSSLGYLGSPDGSGSYGVSWRDEDPATNNDGTPYKGPKRTRVTGNVVNSKFYQNYYGIYTYQASNMRFEGNEFHDNIQYGFDPHDFTHDVVVTNNKSYRNGNHGFIISRGCYNFTFTNNVSYENAPVEGQSKNQNAHGFMLDPGAEPDPDNPNAVAQSPSTNNVFENNIAYGNKGYGFRILGSNNNTIKNNTFYGNRNGITLEGGSTGNIIESNIITGSVQQEKDGVFSQGYGIYAFGGADGNTITNNTINSNAAIGIYLKTGNNMVTGNTIESNAREGISLIQEQVTTTTLATEERLPADNYLEAPEEQGILRPGTASTNARLLQAQAKAATSPDGNQLIDNTVRMNGTGSVANGITIKNAANTIVRNNTLSANTNSGLALSSNSAMSMIETNVITGNVYYGIEIFGTGTNYHTMTRNSITDNGSGGISVRNNANGGIKPPTLALASTTTISGTTQPGAKVELFTDSGNQAARYEGTVTADATGMFSFTFICKPSAANLTATATDAKGNTSALTQPALSLASLSLPSCITDTPTVSPTPVTPTPVPPTPITPTPEEPANNPHIYLPMITRVQ